MPYNGIAQAAEWVVISQALGSVVDAYNEGVRDMGSLLVVALGIQGLAEGALGGVGATRVEATAHGALRMADPSRLAASQVPGVVNNATQRFTQSDGARVFVREVGGRFNVVIRNEAGKVMNTFKSLRPAALRRLGRNFGWTPDEL